MFNFTLGNFLSSPVKIVNSRFRKFVMKPMLYTDWTDWNGILARLLYEAHKSYKCSKLIKFSIITFLFKQVNWGFITTFRNLRMKKEIFRNWEKISNFETKFQKSIKFWKIFTTKKILQLFQKHRKQNLEHYFMKFKKRNLRNFRNQRNLKVQCQSTIWGQQALWKYTNVSLPLNKK